MVLFYGHAVKQAKTTRADGSKKTWVQVGKNLVRHVETSRYYAVLYRHGKAHWKSLGTTLKTVAEGNLAKERAKWLEEESTAPDTSGKWTVGTALDMLLHETNAGRAMNKKAGIQRKGRLAGASQLYRRQTVEALLKSWKEVHGAELRPIEIRRLTAEAVDKWAFAYRTEVSPGRFNATLGSLRRAIRYAREAGQLHRDPTAGIERESVRKSSLNAELPTRAEFASIVETIRKSGHRTAADSADFVELLAYSGARSSEAAALTWAEVDFTRQQVTLRVTKNGRPRVVPFNPSLAGLLGRLRAARSDAPETETVSRVSDVRGALDKACDSVGCPRITRHGLRGLFASICLQSGIDVKTLADWLGHQDGGLLLLQRYAKAAGAQAAARVSFESNAPEKVITGDFASAA